MKKFNMQNVFLWIKNDQKGGYKFRYVGNDPLINGYLGLQIENSLMLGWDISDIVVITNFEFEHMGVKSHVVNDICRWSSFANKMVVVGEMISNGVINDNFWLHDCDAYQLVPFVFPEKCLDVGFSRHAPGRNKPQGGSAFYRKSAFDIVHAVSEMIRAFRVQKEESFYPSLYDSACGLRAASIYKSRFDELKKRLESNKSDTKLEKAFESFKPKYEYSQKYFGKFAPRFTWLDWSYNLFRQRQFHKKYPVAEKPIRVVHFHPEYESCLNTFYHGKNRYNVKIVTPELSKLFVKYGLVKN